MLLAHLFACLSLSPAFANTAVIIEPRPHELLVPVIENFMAALPDGWTFQLVHGGANEEFVRMSALRKVIDSGELALRKLEHDDLNLHEYNKLLTSQAFWEGCVGEKVLLLTLGAMAGTSSQCCVTQMRHSKSRYALPARAQSRIHEARASLHRVAVLPST